MRLLRHLLPKPRRSGTPRTRHEFTAQVLLELDYDPLVAKLASECR